MKIKKFSIIKNQREIIINVGKFWRLYMLSSFNIKSTNFLSQRPDDFVGGQFFRQSFRLMIPVVFQNLISNMINLLDTLMIERYGHGQVTIDALAAVGYSNQLYFLFYMVCFGLCSGGGVFIAQYYGVKDIKRIRSTFGFVSAIAVILSLIFFVIAFFFPMSFLHIFSGNDETFQMAEGYLKIVAFSYLFNAVSISMSISSRSVQQAAIPTVASLVGLFANFFGNYIFIFGNFGMPSLGVNGAAIATLSARILEFLVMLALVYWKREILAGTISEFKNFTKNFISEYVKISVPVVLNESIWSLGMFMYSVAYSKLGASAVASVQIATVVTNLLAIFLFGLANACGAMVGEQLGRNHKHMAAYYALIFGRLSFVTGIIVSVLLMILSFFLDYFLQLDADTLNSIQKILWAKAFWLPLVAWDTTLIVGILRCGGDTRFSLMLDIGVVWIVGVPLAFAGAALFKLPIYLVVMIVGIEDLFRFIIGVKRFYSEKWIKKIISNNGEFV